MDKTNGNTNFKAPVWGNIQLVDLYHLHKKYSVRLVYNVM